MKFARYASVLIEKGPPKPLTYGVPEGWTVHPGTRVEVPLRDQTRIGTIVELSPHSPPYHALPLHRHLSSEEAISADLWDLANWMARYYATPLSRVLRCLMPKSVREGAKEKRQLTIEPRLTQQALLKLCIDLRTSAPAQAKALEVVVAAKKGLLLTELLEKAEISRSSVKALVDKGALHLREIAIDRSPLQDQEYFQTEPKRLTSEQQEALDKILSAQGFQVHLLAGVTGSGKTEVYLQAIAAMLSEDKGTIVLLPEITLTTQMVDRFRSRFQQSIAVLHHRLSDGERVDEWRRIRQSKARVVLGARSAIFSPVPNLGLIIVDEEHEQSYKQSDAKPCYHARDVAVMRGHLTDATVVLGSATPSLESYHNARCGKYSLSRLSKRADDATIPKVHIVNMREAYAKAGGYTLFCDELLGGLRKRFLVGEQTILFLNRRGYSSMQWCTACGQAVRCAHCDLSLTFHRNQNSLSCHLCGYTLSPPPRACPQCGDSEPIKFRGAGTEQVERALHAVLPELRTLRIDADTTRHKGTLERLLRQFRTGQADVLIGTQMIAKGLHFPQVTLVGVLNSDASLQIPDFRASEQVFSLLTQVAGRAGRGATPGEVIIQTATPDHPIIQLAASQDYDVFFQREIESRQRFGFPPFTHLIKLTFSSKSAEAAWIAACQLQRAVAARLQPPHIALPPHESGYAKIKDRFRFQCLLKGPSIYHMHDALKTAQPSPSSAVELSVDVDPVSTFF